QLLQMMSQIPLYYFLNYIFLNILLLFLMTFFCSPYLLLSLYSFTISRYGFSFSFNLLQFIFFTNLSNSVLSLSFSSSVFAKISNSIKLPTPSILSIIMLYSNPSIFFEYTCLYFLNETYSIYPS